MRTERKPAPGNDLFIMSTFSTVLFFFLPPEIVYLPFQLGINLFDMKVREYCQGCHLSTVFIFNRVAGKAK